LGGKKKWYATGSDWVYGGALVNQREGIESPLRVPRKS